MVSGKASTHAATAAKAARMAATTHAATMAAASHAPATAAKATSSAATPTRREQTHRRQCLYWPAPARQRGSQPYANETSSSSITFQFDLLGWASFN
jgi:hypothetical protein